MKKMLYIGVLLILSVTLNGCSNEKGSSSSTKESTTKLETKSSSEEKSNKKINSLEEIGSIEYNKKIMYTLELTEVMDVTQEAKNEKLNDSNYLDLLSNGQGKQAVQITLKMKNLSGEVLGLPYLDDVKVIDADGITNVGGWKNEGSTKTEFGFYQSDSNFNTNTDLYEISDGETKLATSTVLLVTPSDTISFTFKSEKFNDEILFEVPIQK